ncbi:long-chain fatty acid--CoA ligase [Candidatus Sumerlaeota bacterium]|nr:long-chain fatty acid--CoA ligase [Candidatus Sumerlaeota bacterium]
MSEEKATLELTLPARSIHAVLLDQADGLADAVAIEFEGTHVTYGDAAERSRRFASALRGLGIEKGDRVGIMLPNRPEFLYAYYGALMAGAIVVLYNVMLTPDEIRYICDDSGTKAMVVLDRLLPNVQKATETMETFQHAIVVGETESPERNFSSLIDRGDPEFEAEETSLDDIALLVYTSGTTGKPKGAMLSHSNVLSNLASMHLLRPPQEGTKVLCVLPLFHVFGLIALLNLVIMRGGTLYLQPRFEAEAVINALKTKGITQVSGTPTMFFHILNHPSSQGASFPDLTRVGCGGAPLPVEIRQRFHERFGVEIKEGYGLTESTVSLCGYPDGLAIKSGSIGVPNPGDEMKIVDEEGNESPVGEIGEIIARGPNIMVGYWNNPEETAKTLRDGWLYTGDLGSIDDEGYFFILDRKKDMIIKGGYNIYPREIEEVIYQLPEINMAAVIGVPDEAKGEVVHAIVSLKDDMETSGEAVMAHLRGRLSKYKLPETVTIIPTIPTGPTGKILKRELRANWAEISAKEPVQS